MNHKNDPVEKFQAIVAWTVSGGTILLLGWLLIGTLEAMK